LTFSLDQAPVGASIDAVSGEFSWTPTATQDRGVFAIIVRVADDGDPSQSATARFFVAVGVAGDINGDGVVGLSDLAILQANLGRTTPLGIVDGDLTGDGVVDRVDVAALAAHYGRVAAPPAPAAAAALAADAVVAANSRSAITPLDNTRSIRRRIALRTREIDAVFAGDVRPIVDSPSPFTSATKRRRFRTRT
jgi:hypothetical protein